MKSAPWSLRFIVPLAFLSPFPPFLLSLRPPGPAPPDERNGMGKGMGKVWK